MSKAEKERQRAAELADKIDALKTAIAHRRAGMAKAKAKALSARQRGRLATGWFAAWSRQVETLAQSVAKLDRLRARLPGIVERVRLAKVSDARKARSDAFIASMIPRLDRLIADAPAFEKHLKADRKAEKKRIKALKAKIAARQADPPAPRPRPEPTREQWLKSTVEQPVDAGPGFTPNVVAEGYTLGPLLDLAPLPSRWDARHVGARLIEAQRVVRMLPESIGPRSFGKAWPAYQHTPDDLSDQEADRAYRARAGAAEIARALEAISWPVQFLSNRGRYSVALLNYWASEADDPEAPNSPKDLLETIASALNAAREPVR